MNYLPSTPLRNPTALCWIDNFLIPGHLPQDGPAGKVYIGAYNNIFRKVASGHAITATLARVYR